MTTSNPDSISTRRIWLARGVAIVADAVQLGGFAIFSPGFLSPFNDVLDVVVCGLLIFLVGWHIAFLPTFIVKDLPLVDLAPTWTVAVLIATRKKNVKPGAQAPMLPGKDQRQDGHDNRSA
jgi:hypothetical protein